MEKRVLCPLQEREELDRLTNDDDIPPTLISCRGAYSPASRSNMESGCF